MAPIHFDAWLYAKLPAAQSTSPTAAVDAMTMSQLVTYISLYLQDIADHQEMTPSPTLTNTPTP